MEERCSEHGSFSSGEASAWWPAPSVQEMQEDALLLLLFNVCLLPYVHLFPQGITKTEIDAVGLNQTLAHVV